ncbi:hypothetical protein [Streptomyces sp. NBC_01304]|uniref:hypothetical protein n=1 Tax=Streptomyces sp. NBC_01304 TaxID=2903818 RepID=UPI002E0D4EF9|nr:hypothetical protein OG430_01610 [Streptomyces sp. NBC_01304]
MAGGAAAAFTAVAAVPAGAAENGVSFTRVKFNAGEPIVIGVSQEVEVPASFRMTTTRRWDGGPTVFPYRGNIDSSHELWNTIFTSDCIRVSASVCDFTETLVIDPTHYDFGNEDAGTWKIAARVFLEGDAHDMDDEGLTVQVKRNTRLTVNASPEPVDQGKPITVTGKVTRANWDTHKYPSYGGRKVSLQFQPEGATSYTTVKAVYADSSGGLRTTVTAGASGTWRWRYYGNSTSGPSTSSGDHVVVQ